MNYRLSGKYTVFFIFVFLSFLNFIFLIPQSKHQKVKATYNYLQLIQTRGGIKEMNDISTADEILSLNRDTHKQEYLQVLSIEKRKNPKQFILVNDNLLFYFQQSIYANENLVHAKDLKVGDKLESITGKKVLVRSIKKIKGDYDSYDIKLPTTHTYYINDILVHNASRYWVAGTGNWSDNTNHWSDSSGGSPGASKPTNSDNCIFDNGSFNGTSQVVTLNETGYCHDFDWSGYNEGQTPGFAGTFSRTIEINGSFTLISDMNYTAEPTYNFTSTSTGETITTAGKDLNYHVVLNGVGGEWTLQDSLLIDFWSGPGVLYLQNGSFVTNNQTITVEEFNSNYTNTRSLTLGSSTINITGNAVGSWALNTTNLTFDSGTSTINLNPPSNLTFTGGGAVYYNVVFTSNTSLTVTGANTYNNFTFDTSGAQTLTLPAGVTNTINGTFTVDGPSQTSRITVTSNTPGTAATLSAAALAIDNTNFFDITGAGAASWDGSSSNWYDCQGNTGLTFTPADTYYWVGGDGDWNVPGEWSTSSGGAGGTLLPTCQDDVVFDSNSFTAGGQYTDARGGHIAKNITFSGVTNNPQFRVEVDSQVFGNITLDTNMTMGDNNELEFVGRGLQTITTNNVTVPIIIDINTVGGTYTLQDSLTHTYTFYLNRGTFDANDFNVQVATFNSSTDTYSRTLNMGAGTWTGIDSWDWDPCSNLTVNVEGSDINFNISANETFDTCGRTFNNLEITTSGAYILETRGNNTWNSVTINTPGAIWEIQNSGTQTVGTLTAHGNSDNDIIIRRRWLSGTANLSATTVDLSYVRFDDIVAQGSAVNFACTNNCTDGGANTGINWYVPSAPTTLYSNNTTAQAGQTNPTGLTDTTPAFSAVYNDSDTSDTGKKYQVVVYDDSSCAGSIVWDSGSSGTVITNCSQGTRCEDINYGGSALTLDGEDYSWKIRYWDNQGGGGAVGTYSSCATFTMDDQIPTATTPSSISQATDASGYVTFLTTISDPNSDETKVKVEYSDDGGSTWYDPDLVSVTPSAGSTDLDDGQIYQIGTVDGIDTDSGDITLTIVWDTQSATNENGSLDGTDQSDIQVRVTPNDSSTDGSVAASTSFEVDNVDPTTLADLAVDSFTATTVTLTWTAAVETNFNHYEVWYGTNQSAVEARTASEWDNGDDADLTTLGTTDTTVTGLSGAGPYYFRLWAIDDYGNLLNTETVSQTLNQDPTAPTSLGGAALVDGSFGADSTPSFSFTLTDPDTDEQVRYQIQIDDSAGFDSVVVDYTAANAAEGARTFTIGQAAGSGSYTTGSEGQTLADGSYYWRVKNIDDSNAESSFTTANSGDIAFKIDATGPSTPGTPSTTSPTNDTTPSWTWISSTDSGSGLADTPYIVEWCTDSGFIDCESNNSTSATNSFTHFTVLSENTWNFRIKAIDTLSNQSLYSSNGLVIIDTTAPTFSNITTSTTENSTTITWNTNELASTQVEYGLTSSYGNSSTETDTQTRVLSHSTTISNLIACTTYQYRVKSTDASSNSGTSTNNIFTTDGCIGSAEVQEVETSTVVSNSGGSVELKEDGNSGITLTIPGNYSATSHAFQIQKLDKTPVIAAVSNPDIRYTSVGDYIYNIKALVDISSQTSNFDNSINITISYLDSDIVNFEESSLAIYRYDDSAWRQLSNCQISASVNTVTCTTTSFSIFGLFGNQIDSEILGTSSTTNTPQCNVTPPGSKAPWIFMASAESPTEITLYFSDAQNPYDHYVLEYGIPSSEYIFGQQNIGGNGTRSYKVGYLLPDTTYYFKIKAANDCAPGPWSNEITAKTKGLFVAKDLDIVKTELKPVKEKSTCTTYEVKSGDYLWSISEKLLGEGYKFEQIIKDNSEKYPSLKTSNNLTVGWELKVCDTSIATAEKEKSKLKPGYEVQITVVDEDNNPVEGAEVTLYSEPKVTHTDKKGIAKFIDIEKGDHRVVIAYKDYKGEQSINLAGDVARFDLNITVKKSNTYFSPLSLCIIGLLSLLVIFLTLKILRR